MTSSTNATAMRDDDRPPFDPSWLRWGAEGDPVPDDTNPSLHVCRWVPWLTQERLAQMLDSWVGPFAWSVSFDIDRPNAVAWCHLTVRNVTKSDVSDLDHGPKAGVTKAFNRCAMRQWGIGRDVHHIPHVWAPCKLVTVDGVSRVQRTIQTVPTIEAKLRQFGHAGIDPTLDGEIVPDSEREGPPADVKPPGQRITDAHVERLAAELGRLEDRIERLSLGDLPEQYARWRQWAAANHGWWKTADAVQSAHEAVNDILKADGAEPFGTEASDAAAIAGSNAAASEPLPEGNDHGA